jgi:chromosome segregation ATPase
LFALCDGFCPSGDELVSQQKQAAELQDQAAQLALQLAETEMAKVAAEQRATELSGQLTEVEGEMTVLQHAQQETEQLAAQVAADLAAAREWAHANAQKFLEVQKQLGDYQVRPAAGAPSLLAQHLDDS